MLVAKNPGEYVPSRADIVWLDFNPTKGHEQAGKRPALVISPQQYTRATGLAIVCPITTKKKGYPFEVEVGGVIKGVILCDQLRTVDVIERNAEYVESVNSSIISSVKKKIDLLLP